ncbi:MAG: hypothetical protein R2769_13435 [Saprospiraceae bacterium]
MIDYFSKYISFVSGLFVFIFLLSACEKSQEEGKKDDKILARVQNRTLYLSELEGMVPSNVSPEDSILFINSLIERWAREAVLLQEAELNLPKDLNLDKLVRDYRSSLVKNNYEQILVEQFLDSTITRQELSSYYSNNKEQLALDEPLVRYFYMKIPLGTPDLDKAENWWKNFSKDDNRKMLTQYAEKAARDYVLTDSSWIEISKLSYNFPPGWLNATNIDSKGSFMQSDDNFKYFFKKEEVISANSEPPFSFVEPKIKRLILHQRKQKLLDKKKEEMYQRELRQNNVEIFR